MEPSQLTHLREAASELRIHINDITKEVMEEGLTAEDEIVLRKIERLSKDAERALTRIDMCLREFK